MPSGSITSIRSFQPGDELRLREIMQASLAVDRIPGFDASDIDRAISRVPADPAGCLVAEEGGRIVGYCIPRHDDLTVDPAYRRRGHGRRLVEAASELVRSRGLPHLMLHGPTHLESTRTFIEAMGARYHSSLWLFRLPPDADVPRVSFPADLVSRTLAEDEDLGRFVELMNATFRDHPTPLSWTLDTVRVVHDLPDFDRHGVLIVSPHDAPDEPIAFTKVEFTDATADEPASGWVGLIGVLPAWRGRGLGRALLDWGVRYLRERGAVTIELAAEALNERATAIYRRAGFVQTVEWPHYVIDV